MGQNYEKQKNKKRVNVERVKDDEELKNILSTLANQNYFKESERNTMIFKLGLVTGLRISDLVRLKRADVENKTQVVVTEKKTGKARTIYLKPVYFELMEYIKFLDENQIENEYLFYNHRKHPSRGHVQEKQFYKIMQKLGEILGLDHLGTHTMRKTFAYKVYMDKNNIRLVMDLLNHSSERITLRYIGILEEEKKETVENIQFF